MRKWGRGCGYGTCGYINWNYPQLPVRKKKKGIQLLFASQVLRGEQIPCQIKTTLKYFQVSQLPLLRCSLRGYSEVQN
jgi:hypothetical protein